MKLNVSNLDDLGIEKNKFGRIYTFVDFGNVNKWHEKDRKDVNGELLREDKKLIVEIKGLSKFIQLFSEHKRFYYGLDLRKRSTWHITRLAKKYNFVVIKKSIQWIKHYLETDDKEIKLDHKIKRDKQGIFIEIAKCNFDVELTIDAIRLIDRYDTFALFSGDSDFSMLLRFLKNKNKRIVLFYAGHISRRLKDYADLLINAQKIKGLICTVKTVNSKKNPPKGVRKSDSHPRAG